MQRGRRVLLNGVEQKAVKLLYKIVTALVKGVNRAFNGGNGGVAGARVARLVLAVPEIEVGAVLMKQGGFEIPVPGRGMIRFGVVR